MGFLTDVAADKAADDTTKGGKGATKGKGLSGSWHGIPVWALALGGVAGAYLLYKHFKNASSSSSSTNPAAATNTTGAGTGATGGGYGGGAGGGNGSCNGGKWGFGHGPGVDSSIPPPSTGGTTPLTTTVVPSTPPPVTSPLAPPTPYVPPPPPPAPNPAPAPLLVPATGTSADGVNESITLNPSTPQAQTVQLNDNGQWTTVSGGAPGSSGTSPAPAQNTQQPVAVTGANGGVVASNNAVSSQTIKAAEPQATASEIKTAEQYA